MFEERYTNRKMKEPKKFKLESQMFPPRKQMMFFAIGWFGFQVIALLTQILYGFIFSAAYKISITSALTNLRVQMLVNATAYLVLFTILIALAYSDLLKIAKSFKQYQSYIAAVVCFAAIIVFNILYSYIVSLLREPVSSNINQQSLDTMDSLYPFTSMIVFGFIGPICEEITYRVGLFSLFKRKSRWLAYVITIIVFAFIHFNFETKSLINELLNLPFYAFAAVAFSFTYEHFGFAGSATAHIINNVFSLSAISLFR